MREAFPDLMPLPLAQRDLDFERATIVLDTNVLLNLYRYSQKTSERFLYLLDQWADHLWMPHQVGWEFLRRRDSVRLSLTEQHDRRIKALTTLRNTFRDSPELLTHIERGTDEARFLKALDTYTKRLEGERTELASWAKDTDDGILSELDRLFSGDAVGSKPDSAWYQKHAKAGEDRYKTSTPPGFQDAGKRINKYGDYYLWEQMIEEAAERKRPMVFVTSDLKSDWWEFHDTKRLGPRAELLEEFHDRTGQHLMMYATPLFFQLLDERIHGSSDEDTDEQGEAQSEIAALQRVDTSAESRLAEIQKSAYEMALSNVDPKVLVRLQESVKGFMSTRVKDLPEFPSNPTARLLQEYVLTEQARRRYLEKLVNPLSADQDDDSNPQPTD